LVFLLRSDVASVASTPDRTTQWGQHHVHEIAQTHLQLFNQLIDAGWLEDELIRIRLAYDLQVELFGGSRTQSGKFHEAHNIGTASILAAAGADVSVVGAGLLHNAYNTGDFGDVAKGATTTRRAELRSVLGERGEACVAKFEKRHRWMTPDALARSADEIDPAERDARLIWLAEELDHHVDFGLRYRFSMDNRNISVDIGFDGLLAVARDIGHDRLATLMEEICRAEDEAQVPESLRTRMTGQHPGVSRSWIGGPKHRRSPVPDRVRIWLGGARRAAGRVRRRVAGLRS